MNKKKIIQQAIEQLYGPCPVGDFVHANEWASHLDWVQVKEEVDKEHPDFEWSTDESKAAEEAEAMVTEARHEMLHRAGHAEE